MKRCEPGSRERSGRKPGRRRINAAPAPAILAVLVILFAAAPHRAAAETKFSGELKPEVVFNIPGNGGYDESPLNPGNQWGYDDVMFSSSIDLKLDAAGETAALDLWLSVSQYPMADLLTGSAMIAEGLNPGVEDSGDDGLSGYSSAVADLFYVADPYIFALDIMRASAAWQPADALKITFGRQSFLTGYGYGWNPVDLANPPKDPTDPGAYIRGVDALTVQFSPAAWLNAKLYGALPSRGFAWGYEEILAGCELTFYVTPLEIKLAGLWGGTESSSDEYDAYPHAAAAAVYADVFGLGLYAEGALRSRSRRNDPDSAGGDSTIADGPVWSALAGMEYYFASGPSLAVEYFYNGEGWDESRRSDYIAGLDAAALAGGVSGDQLALYTPTYFSRHYILANLMIPWYAIEATFNVNAIWAVDSAALILTPSASFNLNYDGTLVSEIWYSGLFGFDDSGDDEASLAPVRHSASVNMRYYF